VATVSSVLVVEDNDAERRALCQILKSEGYLVQGVAGADKAIGYLNEKIDIVVSDVELVGPSGMDLLKIWEKKNPHARFILVTGDGNIPDAVLAMKAGAFDYVCKPLSREKLTVLVGRAMEAIRAEREPGAPRRAKPAMVGTSEAMKAVVAKLQRAARVDSTVLILGESGTGKELAAEALHSQSGRKGPFVAINVSAVPATLVESELFGHVRGAFTGATDRRIGRFEQADGGTLFIDEIGDFDLALQPKLLRVIEALTLTPVGGHDIRKVDVRVIAATSRPLAQMVKDGRFREDLFYRLNVVQIEIPPLRQRRPDILALTDYFLKLINAQLGGTPRRLDDKLRRRLEAYDWPGNARELRNTLESMLVMADREVLTEADLPPHIASHGALHGEATGETRANSGAPTATVNMSVMERQAIVQALREFHQNRTHAAQKLGISVRTLQRKLRLYNLEQADAEPDMGAGVKADR